MLGFSCDIPSSLLRLADADSLSLPRALLLDIL